MDQRSVLRAQWTKLVDHAEDVQDDLSVAQRNLNANFYMISKLLL